MVVLFWDGFIQLMYKSLGKKDIVNKHYQSCLSPFNIFQAGLSNERFALALEPEVASLTSREISQNCRSVLNLGTKYIIVDIGGG